MNITLLLKDFLDKLDHFRLLHYKNNTKEEIRMLELCFSYVKNRMNKNEKEKHKDALDNISDRIGEAINVIYSK